MSLRLNTIPVDTLMPKSYQIYLSHFAHVQKPVFKRKSIDKVQDHRWCVAHTQDVYEEKSRLLICVMCVDARRCRRCAMCTTYGARCME